MTSEEIKARIRAIRSVEHRLFWGPVVVLGAVGLVMAPFTVGVQAVLLGLAVGFGIGTVLDKIATSVIRHHMYRPLAKRMQDHAQNGRQAATSYRWWDPSPGAMAITEDDTLVLIHDTTGFERVEITPEQLLGARVEVRTETTAQTRTSGSSSIGIASSSGIGIARHGGSRSTTTFTQQDTVVVELMWRTGRNTHPHCVTIGSPDRRSAEGMAAVVNGLCERRVRTGPDHQRIGNVSEAAA